MELRLFVSLDLGMQEKPGHEPSGLNPPSQQNLVWGDSSPFEHWNLVRFNYPPTGYWAGVAITGTTFDGLGGTEHDTAQHKRQLHAPNKRIF